MAGSRYAVIKGVGGLPKESPMLGADPTLTKNSSGDACFDRRAQNSPDLSGFTRFQKPRTKTFCQRTPGHLLQEVLMNKGYLDLLKNFCPSKSRGCVSAESFHIDSIERPARRFDGF